MGRNLDPVCKQCRREGMKLYLKGSRCESKRCPISGEHPAAPGMHGTKRTKLSEYGLRLREKQKLKRFYGLLERQFQRFFSLATRSPENTGEKLLTLLERRLDNVVHRLGFAPSRPSARQLVAHGHILVNGRVCNIPSRLLKLGDTVSVRNRKVSLDVVRVRMLDSQKNVPDFLDLLEEEVPTGKMIREPSRADVDPRIKEIREQLIIEVARR